MQFDRRFSRKTYEGVCVFCPNRNIRGLGWVVELRVRIACTDQSVDPNERLGEGRFRYLLGAVLLTCRLGQKSTGSGAFWKVRGLLERHVPSPKTIGEKCQRP